jgi:hypothetical protein
VFVGDENAGQRFRRAGHAGHPLPDLPSAQTGVDQKPDRVRFQIRAIAARAAAQNSQVNRHRTTLKGPMAASNLFRKKRLLLLSYRDL